MSADLKHHAFAQDVAALMRKHDAYGIDIKYRLSGEGVFEEGRVTYDRGRHDEPGKINVIVTRRIGDFKEERPTS